MRDCLDLGRQRIEALPKPLRGEVPQSSRAVPLLYSASASWARLSSLPDAASDSICASQAAASNSANHARNLANSAGDSCLIEFSRDSTVAMIFTHGDEVQKGTANQLWLQAAIALADASACRHSRTMRSISSWQVGMSLIRPITMPAATMPPSISPLFMAALPRVPTTR